MSKVWDPPATLNYSHKRMAIPAGRAPFSCDVRPAKREALKDGFTKLVLKSQSVLRAMLQASIMNSEEYIETRLQDQIEWYNRKSSENQKKFKHLRASEIAAAALIPFLSGISASIPFVRLAGTVIIGLLGLIVTIIASLLSLGRYQEQWVEYRMTCESLKKEKLLFQTKVVPYDTDDAFRLLVQRVENLVSKENSDWSQFLMKTEPEKQLGKG